MAADGSVIIDIKGDASDITNSLKSSMVAANLLTGAIEKSVSAVTDFVKSSINVGKEFDSSMAQVAATMGVTTGEIQNLRDFAMEMGATTAFSATQAADALNYMALAGYDAETSMEMLPNVLNLAAAGGIDLARASDMVTDAASALGLSMEETTELVDKMAQASSKSNTSVAQLGDAILTVGGTAKNLAGGTTELATALGILADNGVKGAEGGTALRNIILSLSAPTDKAAKKLESLGVSAYDATGNLRPLNETFGDLSAALSQMTQGEQTEVLNTLFNKVDLKSVNALLANTGERFDELAGYIDNAAGAAERMAETQLDNLAGDITLMESAVEGLQIALSDKLTPYARMAVQALTDLAGQAQAFVQNGGIERAIQGIASAIEKMIPLLTAAASAAAAFAAVKAFQEAQAAVALFTVEVGKANLAQVVLSGSMTAFQTAVALLTGQLSLATLAEEAMAAAGTALNAVLSANPAALLAGAIAAMVGAAAAYTIETVNAKTATDDFITSLEESKNAYADMQTAFAEERNSISSTVASLVELLGVEEKSAAQNEIIAQKVQELNDTLPGLDLAYDELTGSINMTVDELKEFADVAVSSEKHESDIKRLSELYSEQAEITEKLKEAQEELAEAQERYNELTASGINSSNLAEVEKAANEVGKLKNNVEELTAAQEANADEITELEAATNSYAKQVKKAASSTSSMTSSISGVISRLDQLSAAYTESFNKAYENISKEIGLFQEMDSSAESSINDLISALKSQSEYMDKYAENIKKAMEMGVNEGIIQTLSDGSEESAKALDAIVKGGKEKIAELNAEFEKVQEGKENFSDAVAEMQTNFSENMDAIVEEMNNTVGELNVGSEMYGVGVKNIQQLISGINSKKGDVIAAVKEIANSMLSAANGVGSNVGLGVAKGITKSSESVERATSGLSNGIKTALRDDFKISSPSKWARDEVGRYIGEGIAVGIEQSAETVKAATSLIGESVADGLATGLSSGIKSATPGAVEAAKTMVDEITGEIFYSVQDANKKFEDAMAELREAFIAGVVGGEEYKNKQDELKEQLTKDINAEKNAIKAKDDMIKALNDEVKALEKQIDTAERYEKNLEKLAARNVPAELADQIKEMGVEASDELVNLLRMTEDELADYVELFRRKKELEEQLGVGSEETEKEGKKTNDKMEKYNETRFANMKKLLDQETKYRNLSLQEQYRNWVILRDQFNEKDAQYAEAEQQLEGLREQILDEYYNKVKDTYANINELEENYQKELASRTKEIEKEYGLFTRVSEREVVSGDYITRTLKGQIATLEEFYGNLDTLAERGAPQELVEQIRDMGVDAVDELAALVSMSDEELDAYAELYQQKHKLAVEQATKELEPLREETDAKIEEQLQSVKDLYDQNVGKVADAFTDGLADGIIANMDKVADAAREVVRKSMQEAWAAASAYSGGGSIGSYGMARSADVASHLRAAGVESQLMAAVERSSSALSSNLSAAVNNEVTYRRQTQQAATAPLANSMMAWQMENNQEVAFVVDGQKLATVMLPYNRAAAASNPVIKDDG